MDKPVVTISKKALQHTTTIGTNFGESAALWRLSEFNEMHLIHGPVEYTYRGMVAHDIDDVKIHIIRDTVETLGKILDKLDAYFPERLAAKLVKYKINITLDPICECPSRPFCPCQKDTVVAHMRHFIAEFGTV